MSIVLYYNSLRAVPLDPTTKSRLLEPHKAHKHQLLSVYPLINCSIADRVYHEARPREEMEPPVYVGLTASRTANKDAP